MMRISRYSLLYELKEEFLEGLEYGLGFLVAMIGAIIPLALLIVTIAWLYLRFTHK